MSATTKSNPAPTWSPSDIGSGCSRSRRHSSMRSVLCDSVRTRSRAFQRKRASTPPRKCNPAHTPDQRGVYRADAESRKVRTSRSSSYCCPVVVPTGVKRALARHTSIGLSRSIAPQRCSGGVHPTNTQAVQPLPNPPRKGRSPRSGSSSKRGRLSRPTYPIPVAPPPMPTHQGCPTRERSSVSPLGSTTRSRNSTASCAES
jgi:hypothetical protein